MTRAAIFAALLALSGCASEMIYADSYSYQRVMEFQPGVTTLDEVRRQLGAERFTVGYEKTWIQSRSRETGLRVTEITMSFSDSGVLTSAPRYSRRGY